MWRERVILLNGSPNTQLFNVGASGILVGGTVEACKGSGYPVTVSGLKPGIWHISLTDNNPESRAVLLRWVAPGPLDFDNLPAHLPDPHLAPLSAPRRVNGYDVDGGIHGLLDQESLDDLIRANRNNRLYVLEAISDYWVWGKNVAVEVGFVIGSADGPYSIVAREHDGHIVELSVRPDNPPA
ncbi:hypothetical protein EUX98_g3854 [Antrodiella citrinella]|uniref:Uncharacterized protein n=1 Tax=Antrodiella citrinella TaxID=2447956 RepID=A0A4S4MXK8_9APHY|nr:hypothetical protein EUX98_g3854 [Antrodiella citrinella]